MFTATLDYTATFHCLDGMKNGPKQEARSCLAHNALCSLPDQPLRTELPVLLLSSEIEGCYSSQYQPFWFRMLYCCESLHAPIFKVFQQIKT